MSTHAITHVEDEVGRTILTMYRQSDGYPSGHGEQLAEFLSNISLEGYYFADQDEYAEGMGCLAAQIVAFFKDGPGEFMIVTPGMPAASYGYEYTVSVAEGYIMMKLAHDGQSYGPMTAKSFLNRKWEL